MMRFETNREVLDWYEKQPRALTGEFIGGIVFEGEDGLNWIDKNVSQKLQQLPGFEGLTKVSDKIGKIVASQTLTV